MMTMMNDDDDDDDAENSLKVALGKTSTDW